MSESRHTLWSETTVGEVKLLDQGVVFAVSNSLKNCIKTFIVYVVPVFNYRARVS